MAKVFDTKKGKAPYGVVVNSDRSKRKYYDIDGVFYDNVEEINIIQDVLKLEDEQGDNQQ